MNKAAALMIYVEPTPYTLGLIRQVIARSSQPVEALFIAGNLSQSWNLALDNVPASYLPKRTFGAVREIRRRLASGRYGLLHVAGWGHPIFQLALLLAWNARLPVFMESDTPLPAISPLWKRVLKRISYPVLFSIPRTVMPAGSRQAEYFRYYGVRDDRIVKGQMTVDVAAIMRYSDSVRTRGEKSNLRRGFGLCESQTVFVSVGRLEPYKGIINLLDAFAGLNRLHPECSLLIAGDGSERGRVEVAACDNPRIRYLGRLQPDDVIRAYNCADISVVPSTFEPWGLVVNEAMAAGLPVIVADCVGCIDDLVRHGKTGLVFPAGSTRHLQEAMQYLLEKPDERIQMGIAGRDLISSWTLDNQARITVETWRRGGSA